MTELAAALGVGAVLVSDWSTLRWLGLRRTADAHLLITAASALVLLPDDAQPAAGVLAERYDKPEPRACGARPGRATRAVAVVEAVGARVLSNQSFSGFAGLIERI